MDLIKKFKREFVYAVLIFIVWEMAQVPEVLGIGWVYSIFAFLGALLVVTWVITSYFHFSHKKVSEKSKVLIKVKMKERFLINFILPLLFYGLVTYYLYISTSVVLKQFIIIVSSFIFFIVFIHIRSSYMKIFTLARDTKVILNFVDIILFYLVVTLIAMYGGTDWVRVIGVAAAAFVFLGHQLLLHKQRSIMAYAVLAVSTLAVAIFAYIFLEQGSYTYPLLLSIVFYTIVSIWNVRLGGTHTVSDYLPPILFALMAYVIVISF
jgi:hypothetical protein